MATPVARSLFNDGKASLRLIRASLLSRSNANAVKDQSLLAPSGIILGQCQFQSPSLSDLNRPVKVSAPHLLGRSPLIGGGDWRGLGREYRLTAEGELEMRRRTKIADEEDEDELGSEDGGFNSDDVGDFDVADFDFDDDDGDDNDDDDEDVPRKRRK